MSLEEKLAAQKRMKALESERNQRRRALFDSQDEIDRKRGELISQLEAQLTQKVAQRVPVHRAVAGGVRSDAVNEMNRKQKLELTWIGKENQAELEPRILLEDREKSHHAAHRVTDHDIFDNRLIFGDNLLALKALEHEFTGTIKCIFIDPPYNTGMRFRTLRRRSRAFTLAGTHAGAPSASRSPADA